MASLWAFEGANRRDPTYRVYRSEGDTPIQYYYVAGLIGIVSTVWFTIGGTWDLRRMFRRLAAREANLLDDGRVIGHVSADDVTVVEKVEHVVIKEVHDAEKALAEELKEEQEKDAEHKNTD